MRDAGLQTRDAVLELVNATEALVRSSDCSSRVLIRLNLALVVMTAAVSDYASVALSRRLP